MNFELKDTQSISTTNFIDTKLKLYSAHSNVRGIPFIGDGFKEAQRKAIYGMVTRGENADKDTVERLSARCAAESDYHHGTTSMEGTIISLAQSFAGSNNIPLIEGFGQFGDRLSRKAASARYIKAKLSTNFRKYFKKDDDLILEYKMSNGEQIEPKHFIPLLPMSLINGAEGMGTGHSTYILTYNPLDIKGAIAQVLSGKVLTPYLLTPWFDGFTGTVVRDKTTGQVIITGKFERVGNLSIKVSDLPVGVQDEAYEEHLYKLKDKDIIRDFTNQSDATGFDYTINVPKGFNSKDDEEILKTLKLVSRESENLTLWNKDGFLKRYNNVEEIITEFVEWRLEQFEKRRLALIDKTEVEILWLDERIRFINFYLDNYKFFKDNKKDVIIDVLEKEEFTRPNDLLAMSIWYLTRDKIEELQNELNDKMKYLDDLNCDTANKMYTRELKELK